MVVERRRRGHGPVDFNRSQHPHVVGFCQERKVRAIRESGESTFCTLNSVEEFILNTEQ